MILNDGIISWSCKTQRTSARSSTEAELSAFDLCSIKAKWLRDLLAEIGFGKLCIPIYGDNLSAITVCTNQEMRERTNMLTSSMQLSENQLMMVKYQSAMLHR